MRHGTEIEVFTREFLAYRPVLARLVARVLRSQTEIDDVLQDVWIKGAGAVTRTRIEHYKSWLGRTAINEALNRLRKERRNPLEVPAKPRDDERPREYADHRPDPYDQLAQAREARRVAQAVGDLPPLQREVVIGRYVDLETFEELAKRSDLPAVTLRSRIHRAFAILRVTLAEERKAA